MSCRSAISRSISASSSMIFWRSSAASRRSCMSRIAWAWISSTSSSSIRPVRATSDRRRRPDQRDDLVQRVERLDAAAQDVGPLLGLAQPVAGPPDDDLDLVADVVAHHLVQPQGARHPVDDGQHVHAEAVLQLGVLVEVVEHDLGDRVALERDHDAHADAVAGLVVDLGDAGELAVADQLGDRLDEVVRVDLVGQLGDDQDRAAAWRPPRPRRRRASGSSRGRSGRRPRCPSRPTISAGGREVGPLIRSISAASSSSLGGLRVARSAQTTPAPTSRRLCGGMLVAMPTAMPGSAVDQQVRDARRQDVRLLASCRRSSARSRRCPRRCPAASPWPAGSAGTRCSAWRRPGRCPASRSCPGRRPAGTAATRAGPAAPACRRSTMSPCGW